MCQKGFIPLIPLLHLPAENLAHFNKTGSSTLRYPEDVERFWRLVKLGEKLRLLHLMEGVNPRQGLAVYDVPGNDVVTTVEYKNGQVWMNDTQFFDHVPLDVWNFYIGGYQSAQKWLKDRKGQPLDYNDRIHYRKIICVLKETIEVMDDV